MRNTLAPLALGIVAPIAQVGYFRAAQAPITGFDALSAPVRLILLTEQTRDVEEGRLANTYRSLRRYVVGSSVVALVIAPFAWILMPWLVRVVLGESYIPATDAARILLLAACLRLVLGWTKSFPVSIGKPGLRIIAHSVEIVTLLPLVILLGAEWGATGAATVLTQQGEAVVCVAWRALELLPPRNGPAGRAPIQVQGVRVWNGRLEWLLLTTRPVETLDQALDIIAWYARRWVVEEFHKAWKTGCRAEQRRLEEADRLVPLLGALAIVAVRLLGLRDAARCDG
jgi:hypothetical protein